MSDLQRRLSLCERAYRAGRRAPKRNAHSYSWEEERQPCGRRGLRHLGRPNCVPPDCSNMLVARPMPWSLVIWEPLETKAPGPHLAQPYCCYIQTVIFYHRPYIIGWPRGWRDREGVFHRDRTGGFIEWDRLESRLCWGDVVVFEGEEFVIGGGGVRYERAPDGGRHQWWMLRDARRREPSV